jgi:hypothetical protein
MFYKENIVCLEKSRQAKRRTFWSRLSMDLIAYLANVPSVQLAITEELKDVLKRGISIAHL